MRRDSGFLLGLLQQCLRRGQAGRHAAGHNVVELARIELLVGGAAGDPHMDSIGPADQAVDVHTLRDDAKAGQRAAIEPSQHLPLGFGADVEVLPSPAKMAILDKLAGNLAQSRAIRQGDAGGVGAYPTEFRQRRGERRLHPADLSRAYPERQAVAGQARIVAGAKVVKEPDVCRLACHGLAFETSPLHAT